jgi:hypothetical protein
VVTEPPVLLFQVLLFQALLFQLLLFRTYDPTFGLRPFRLPRVFLRGPVRLQTPVSPLPPPPPPMPDSAPVVLTAALIRGWG